MFCGWDQPGPVALPGLHAVHEHFVLDRSLDGGCIQSYALTTVVRYPTLCRYTWWIFCIVIVMIIVDHLDHSGETRACTRLKLWGVGILTHVAYVGSVERSEAAAIKDKEQGSCI